MKTIRDHFREIEKILQSPYIASYEIDYDEKSRSVGIVSGTLTFVNGLILNFLELTVVNKEISHPKYRFHLRSKKGMVFRYDNAPHHKALDNFPHHKHIDSTNVVGSKERGLVDVVEEIESLISGKL